MVTATAGSASNYLQDSTQTASITVTVSPAGTKSLDTAALAYGPISATLGTANDTGISPEWTPASGSPAPTGISYSIAAATGDKAPQMDGAGTTVTIDLSTGKITLTAQAVEANSGEYVVTATATSTSNYDPTSTQTSIITVEVVRPALDAASLVYNPASVATTVGTANTTGIDPEWGSPTPTNIVYSIAAAAGDKAPEADGAGDTVKIDSSTGKVTLTAGAISTNAGEYVVTVTAGR